MMRRGKDKLKLPENYFQKLPAKILKKIKQNEVCEELYSISNFVAQHLKKKNLFRLPENYFQQLPEQTKYYIQTKRANFYSFKRELVFMISAASILVVFMLSVFFIQPKKENITHHETVNIDDKTILMALSMEQDEAHLETETIKDKTVLLAVAQSIEEQNKLQKNTLEQEIELDKNLEHDLEKALENELDNL